ncbi:MAG: hypothetical protein U1F56_16440 [Rubrivivax sp.]
MQVFLKLPGHAAAARRHGYGHWLPVQTLQFERPLLHKDKAEFTIHKGLDALSQVLAGHAGSRQRLRVVRLHHVEGSQAVLRLRFDDVQIRHVRIDGTGDEAMECVSFRAGSWQLEG